MDLESQRSSMRIILELETTHSIRSLHRCNGAAPNVVSGRLNRCTSHDFGGHDHGNYFAAPPPVIPRIDAVLYRQRRAWYLDVPPKIPQMGSNIYVTHKQGMCRGWAIGPRTGVPKLWNDK